MSPIPQLKRKQISWSRRSIRSASRRRLKKGRFIKKFLVFFFFLFILGTISVLLAFALFSANLPSPDKLLEREIAQSTRIYDRAGKNLLYEVFAAERRTLVNIREIPRWLIYATITAEDREFYQHSGFNIRGIIRALVMDVSHLGKVQGGSSITQQFIKNALLSPQKTYARKIKELILAYQIEQKFSKNEILQMYFNEIPYGSNAYGAEAASQIYFSKSVKDLTLDECVLLAALSKAPTYYSPYGQNKEEIVSRKNYILNEMANLDFISQKEAEEAKQIDTLSKIKPKKERMIAPHFVMYVKQQLEEKYGHRLVEQGGLKVITTLDLDKQKIAEEAIEKNEENLKKFKVNNAALVAIDIKTGGILAMVGSKDYFDEKIDGYVNVTLSPRQPGSSFKPVVYAKAFEKGYTPETILFDVLTNFGPDGTGRDYVPKDYDEKERGPVTMRRALAGSLNIPGVQTLYLAGVENVLNLAGKMGYTTFTDRSRFGLAIVLGGAEVKLLEHTSAFGVFAREGMKIPTVSILKVEDSQGNILEENQAAQPEKILEPQIARQINSILSDNSARAFMFGEMNYLTLPNRPVAAKTGTTQNWRDAWTLGYTPSLVTGVWVGNTRNEEMKKGADGSKVAAPIWNYFMKEALKDASTENFTPPEPEIVDKPILKGEIPEAVVVKIDRASGKLATSLTPASFIIEKKIRTYHSILYFVDKDNPRGLVPENPNNDPMYDRWEEGVRTWAKKQGLSFDETIPTQYDDLHVPENQPKVTIISPVDGQDINTNPMPVEVGAQAPRGIRRIEALIDGKIGDLIYTPPYILTLNISGFSPGLHKIIVRAYDDIDNQGEAQISINLVGSSLPKIIWLSPKDNETIYTERFPFVLSLLLPTTINIKEIRFYCQSWGSEKKQFLQLTNLPMARVNTTWFESPSAGNYELSLEAVDENNLPVESEKINITIW